MRSNIEEKSKPKKMANNKKLRKLVTSYKNVVFMGPFHLSLYFYRWFCFYVLWLCCVLRLSSWAHVVTELYNLSKEINLSFYFYSTLFMCRLCVQFYFVFFIIFLLLLLFEYFCFNFFS